MNSAVLEDICEIVGYTATRRIAVWFEGKRLYVPRQVYPLHPLRTLLGDEPFRRLVDAACDTFFDIPDGAAENEARRDRRIAERLAAGITLTQLCDETGLGRRRLEKIRKRLADDGWLDYAAGSVGRRWAVRAPPPKLFSEREGFSTTSPLQETARRLAVGRDPPGG